MKSLKFLIPAVAFSLSAVAQSGKSADGFATTEKGLEYKFEKNTHGTKKPAVGDYVELNIRVHIGDSVMFDSRKMNNNQPVPLTIQKPQFDGDPVEGFMMLSPGDSAIFRLPLSKIKNQNLLPWMKPEMLIEYDVAMVSVKTPDEMKKAAAEKAAKQNEVDDKILADYFKSHNVKAKKTASGLYYVMHKEGKGAKPLPGENVTVNYTGKTLDGKTFDSNVDSNFKHVQPFSFMIGRGQVIKGWDEGVPMLNKGASATLYIPSSLAYGERGAGGAIGPNAILMFDVEVTDIKAAPGANLESPSHPAATKPAPKH